MVFELWHRTFIDNNLSATRELTFSDLKVGIKDSPSPSPISPTWAPPEAAPKTTAASRRILGGAARSAIHTP
jgi:hypothetical protein